MSMDDKVARASVFAHVEELERELEAVKDERAAMDELIGDYQSSERKLEAKVAELERQLAASAAQEADAARYQYLRGREEPTDGVGCWREMAGTAVKDGWLYGADLDATIDEQIAALSGTKENSK